MYEILELVAAVNEEELEKKDKECSLEVKDISLKAMAVFFSHTELHKKPLLLIQAWREA